ncbi:Predicted P-loop ATPase and inactivated derivatives [Suttonella indologenes]|uniref:Predicted P-loop ATPase and inactivated derivatives n=2 Tax=Suttonella indologenes TaxID=13276 RepID=A0A380N0A2_9GAMM|nr:Predicted P-loop ATPase and inactivated derivatives [Suttonella indologenes]
MRGQLLAEAVARYQADPDSPLILQGKEALAQAEIAQSKASYSDPWEAVILPWLDEKIRDDHWECEAGSTPIRDPQYCQWLERDRVASLEIWAECLQLPIDKMNCNNSKRIANIMRKAGWEQGNYRYGKRYGAARGYKRQSSAEN